MTHSNTSLSAVPITLKNANEFVADYHRHHGPSRGHKFSIAAQIYGLVVGVVIVGRPVSRMLDNGVTAEVSRLCTDGTHNACSFLYGRAARVCKEMGYTRIQTYILTQEPGTSLKAAGWTRLRVTKGGKWDRPSRHRKSGGFPESTKYLWVKEL